MPRFHKTKNNHIVFHCPGCNEMHEVDSRWAFNNDMDKPTIHPSLLVTCNYADVEHRCHSFVKDGSIQYLQDCTHQMAGTTVDIPDFETTHPDWKDV